MSIKRSPAISKEQHAKYTRISKADLIEAFRDLAREYLGLETDTTEWFKELESRLEIVRRERKAGNSMQYSDESTIERFEVVGGEIVAVTRVDTTQAQLATIEIASDPCECDQEKLLDEIYGRPGSWVADLPSSKCSSLYGYGQTECPKCSNCRKQQFIQSAELPPVPIGEVVRTTEWNAWVCTHCNTAMIDPFKWVYEGDGDFAPMGSGSGVKGIIVSRELWLSFLRMGLAEADTKILGLISEYEKNEESERLASIGESQALEQIERAKDNWLRRQG